MPVFRFIFVTLVLDFDAILHWERGIGSTLTKSHDLLTDASDKSPSVHWHLYVVFRTMIMCMIVNWVIIGSYNVFSSVRHQVTASTNFNIVWFNPWEQLQWNLNHEKVVWDMVAVLFRPQCVK